VVGENAGFQWRTVSNLSVTGADATGNLPMHLLPPQPGPNGIPVQEAYPEVYGEDW